MVGFVKPAVQDLFFGLKGGVVLNSKRVRLWSGMCDGIEQEVHMQCLAPDQFQLVVDVESESTTFPLGGYEVNGLLEGREISVSSPKGSCRLYPAEESLVFAIQGQYRIDFSMSTKQLEVLARRIGLQKDT